MRAGRGTARSSATTSSASTSTRRPGTRTTSPRPRTPCSPNTSSTSPGTPPRTHSTACSRSCATDWPRSHAMRFVVYGAGAIGGVVGARLFQSGHDVVLIARGAHYEAIRDHGLRIQSPIDDETFPIPVVDHPSKLTLTGDDVVLLAMKSQDTI